MRTRRPLSRGVPAPLDGDALTNGARWLAVAGGATGGDGVDLAAIETAIRALAKAQTALRAFEDQRPAPADLEYDTYHQLRSDWHRATAQLWRLVHAAVEEVTE